MPGAAGEDRLALGGTTLVFGSVGLLFALVCGGIPLFTGLMAAEARSIRQRVATGVVQGVGQAGQQVIQGALPSRADVPDARTVVPQRSWTSVTGETVACDGTYYTKYNNVGIRQQPTITGSVDFLPAGKRVQLACDEHLSTGWVQLQADDAQGWTTTNYLSDYLTVKPPPTTPVPRTLSTTPAVSDPLSTISATAPTVGTTSTTATTALACGRTYTTPAGAASEGIPLLAAPNDGAQPIFGLGDNQQVTIPCTPAAPGWVYVVSGPAHGWLPEQAAIIIFRPSTSSSRPPVIPLVPSRTP